MWNLFKRDPRKRLERELRAQSARAVEYQRNGKLKEYARATAEVERLDKELQQLPSPDNP